jgi:drug/metabolite transporter (DMT)-like permease
VTTFIVGFAVVLVWSSCFVAIKASSMGGFPMTYAAARASLAAVALVIVALARGRFWPPVGTWGWLAMSGLSGTALAFIGMFGGEAAGGAAIPGVLAGSQALFVAPLAAIFLKEHVSARRGLALLLGFIGMTGVVVGTNAGPGSIPAALLALLASLGVAASSVVVRHLSGRIEVLTLTAWQFIIGALALIVVALRTENVRQLQVTPAWAVGLLYLALVSSAGGSLAWNWLLKRTDVTSVASMTLLVPALSLVLGVLIFGETVAPMQWLGVFVTMIGVVFAGQSSGVQHQKP